VPTKSLTNVRIKDASLGIVEAVFASHLVDPAALKSCGPEVIDKDGDVTLKGAFTDGQPVVVSAYGHGSWEGKLPIGKGTIREVGSEAIATLQFFMKTQHGADAFETVQQLSEDDLQEWSYSLHDVQSTRGQVGGKAVRILERIGLVKEVSPVLMGAGVATRTLATKQHKQLDSSINRLLRAAGRARWAGWTYVENYDLDEGFVIYGIEGYDGTGERYVQVDFTRTDTSVTLGDVEVEVHETEVYLPKQGGRLQFSENVAAVVADVDALTARASEVVALRAEKGKSISDTTAEQLRHLAGRLEQVKALLAKPTNDNPPDELQHELLRFASLAQGV